MGTTQSNQSTSNGGQSAGGQKQAVGGEVSGSQKQEKEQAEESHTRSERHCEVTGRHQIGSDIPEKEQQQQQQQQQTSGLRKIKDNDSNTSTPVYTVADPPQIVAQPQDNRDVIPKQTLKLTIISTGTEPLKYSWEWNGNGVKVVDSVRKKSMEGEAASGAFHSHFDKLCKQVTPEKIAPLLYTQGIIHRREMKDATNKYNNEEDRAQALLLDLMRSVQSRPQWFHQICEIFDEVLIGSTQDIRVEYQKLLKEAEGWKPIPSDEGRYEGVHSATLTITSVQRSDQGGYRCIVYNDTGSETSEPAVVTVAEAPRISSDPQECEEVIPGEETNMTIKATGTEPLQYSWMYRPLDAIERGINVWALAGGDGVQGADTQDIRVEYQKLLKEAEGWKPIPSDGGRYEGVHSATLTITSVQRSDQGGYRCIVYNDAGSETSKPAIVTVAEAPRISSDPQECEEVIPGEETSMTIKATGTEPLQYSWMYRPLDAIERGINVWALAGRDGVQGADTPTLTITAAQESHQGRYRCVVSNLVGSETSKPGILTLAQPPRIISHPQCEKEVLPQGDVTLSIEAGGSEPLRYSWEWQPQSSEEWLSLEDDDQFEGTATTKLSITNIQKPNSGNYRCVVTSDAGKATSVGVFVNVLSADEIVSHLRVLCIDEGASLEDKIKEVKKFVYKYGSSSEIVKKGLIMVVKMEKEELAIVKAFISDPCFVKVEFVQDGWTPLQYACMQGHANVTNLLLENAANKRVRTKDGKTPLHLAAERGHQNVIMFLIYNKTDVNAQDNDGRTALHSACEAAKATLTQELIQVAAYLLENGARVDLHDKALNTPLHIACKSGNSKRIVELILEYDRDSHCVNSKDREKNTPLHLAASGGFQAITDLLLQKKGDVTCQNEEENTPLHIAILGEHVDVARILAKQLKHDLHSLYLPNKDSNTPLHLASARGMTETVRKILRYHARPINSQNKDDNTPLHLACQGGFRHTVEYLLQNRADPNITNKDDKTPAALAKLSQNKELLNIKGLTPRQTRPRKRLSGVFGDFESSPETSIKVMSRRRCGSSASDTLFSGSFSRSLVPVGHDAMIDTVKAIVYECGADSEDKNTLLHIACKSGNIAVVKKLLENDVEYKTRNAQNNVGNTPLHIAAMQGFHDIAELLVEHGGDLDILNQEGQKPANSAEMYGFSKLAQLLSNPKSSKKSKRRSTFF